LDTVSAVRRTNETGRETFLSKGNKPPQYNHDESNVMEVEGVETPDPLNELNMLPSELKKLEFVADVASEGRVKDPIPFVH